MSLAGPYDDATPLLTDDFRALPLGGLALGLSQGRQEKGRKYCNDGNHDQQFYERKCCTNPQEIGLSCECSVHGNFANVANWQ